MRGFVDSILYSYSTILFSRSWAFGLLIMLVSFAWPFYGVVGLLSVVATNLLSRVVGSSKQATDSGAKGFNAALLGVALAYEYKFSATFLLILLLAVVMLLLITALFERLLSKRGLPYLVIPFIVTYWIVYIPTTSLALLSPQDYFVNFEAWIESAQLSPLFRVVHSMDMVAMPDILHGYFRTLSTTFFQDSVLVGVLLAVGLLLFSRIAFSLTLLGFASAYLWCLALGVDLAILYSELQGLNFIFMSMAVGGFFVVPSWRSYLCVVALTPVLLLSIIALNSCIYNIFYLKSFTLAFSLVTILFLILIKGREEQRGLLEVVIQYYSPEKVLYKTIASSARASRLYLSRVHLPFYGRWRVTQGYNGEHTHLGLWGSALDFSIVDEEGSTYRNQGDYAAEYYCYSRPVLSPMSGYVQQVVDCVDDNTIGQVNMHNNWGNTVVINHQNGLYSSLSHLRKGSVKVKVGDYVERGAIIAQCGNSGRSPYPHLHFQMQSRPYVGSPTQSYPLAYYLLHQGGEEIFKSFSVPAQGDVISAVEPSDELSAAFNLTPNDVITITSEDEALCERWYVHTDAYNRCYIETENQRAALWFEADGVTFSSYDFEGDRSSLLFDFYLATHKILLSNNMGIRMEQSLPTSYFCNPVIGVVQDFLAPFCSFSCARYSSSVEEDLLHNTLTVSSKVQYVVCGKVLKSREFSLSIKDGEIRLFTSEQIWRVVSIRTPLN